MNESIKVFMKLLLIALAGSHALKGGNPEGVLPRGGDVKVSADALTEIVTPMQTAGNRVYYGNLVIDLPDGVTASLQNPWMKEQYTGDVIDLEGYGDKPLPPRVWITHYRADDMGMWAMTGALLDLLPDTTLRYVYRDRDENINVFTYTNGDKNGYILNRGEDIYIVEELKYECKYVFGGLIDDKAVRWDDGQEVGSRFNNTRITFFDMLHIGEDSFVALRYTESGGDGRRWLSLIRDDDLAGRSLDEAAVYQRIELHPVERAFDEWITYKDCNFDGYTDIIASSDAIYLWNPDEKKYGKAQVSGEFLSLPYQVYFPDTETILGYVYDYVDPKPADWNDVDKVESLWQWEGDELVKKRECEAQVRADVVNLQAYDMVFGRKLFEQSVRQEEYSDGSANVQALFAQFYDKLAPADAFSCFHTINYSKEDMTYIPQGLLDQVEGAMLDGTELENLKPMVNDRELSGEEVLAIARDSTDMRQTVIEKSWSGAYLMITADGDNDGMMDIIARESYGGSDGAVDFVFYQGQADGTFRRTDVYPSVREEFGILSYDGRNYLFRTLFDYEKKIYNGISIMCYEEGVCVERADLMLVPEQYETTLAYCTSDRYRPYAQHLAADSLTYKETYEDTANCLGTAEEKLSGYAEYQCDLNNDGVMDRYEKTLWDTSNINVCNYLHFEGGGSAAEMVNDALGTLEGTPVMMWVDESAGKNVVNVMSQTGLEDMAVTGFLMNGTSYRKVYEIHVDAAYGVAVSGRKMGETDGGD